MFDRFEKAKREKSGWRAAAMVVSIVAHVGAAGVLVGWSFWHVERLKTKPVEITQLSLAPPPPALGRPDAPEKPKTVKPRKNPVDRSLNQPTDAKPKDVPVSEPAPDEGVGDEGKGQPNGVEGGNPDAPPVADPLPATPEPLPPPPRPVDIKALEAQRVRGNPQISLPPSALAKMRDAGQHKAIAVVRLCLDASGTPTTVDLVKRTGLSEADDKIVREMRGWRYRPLIVEGRPMPVCAAVQFHYLVD